MFIYIYIYIYISLSLSLYLSIYIYIHTRTYCINPVKLYTYDEDTIQSLAETLIENLDGAASQLYFHKVTVSASGLRASIGVWSLGLRV